MSTYERYQIALEKSKQLKKMNISEYRKNEISMKLGQWIDEKEKGINELPFPFGTKPRKI